MVLVISLVGFETRLGFKPVVILTLVLVIWYLLMIGNWLVLVVRKFLCWNVSSCASKSGRDIQLINACEEPDTTVTFEGN